MAFSEELKREIELYCINHLATVIENVLSTYHSNTAEFDSLMHHVIPIKIFIPENKQHILQDILSHDGKIIVPFDYARKKKEKPQVRFDSQIF